VKKKKKWFRALVRQRFFIILLLVLQLAAIIFFLANRSHASVAIKYMLQIVSFIVALHIIAKRDKGAYKLTWVFTILIFPLFGGCLYLLFRYQTRSKKLRMTMQNITDTTRPAALLPGDKYSLATKPHCPLHAEHGDSPDDACIKASEQELQTSYSAPEALPCEACCMGDKFDRVVEMVPSHARQIEYLDKFAGFPVYENTRTKYLSPGEAFHAALLPELEKAQSYIFLEFFIIEEGIMWDSVLEILKRKVAEGVDVRVIYDDIGCFLRLPKDYPKKLKEAGIRCVVFNKFKPLLTATQNCRDHRKIISVDGKVAFTGGINLSDEYINATHPFGHWKDSGVLVEGEAAWSLTLIFLQMWILSGNKEDDIVKYYPWKSAPCPIVKTDSWVQPYADAPYDAENVSEHVYLQIINTAKKYLYINTPYLIVDDSMISALSLAAKSGVDVRIVTPFRWDKRVVHFTTRSYYRELIRAGVKIYEYSEGFIHSKTFVSDDTVATVGTANLDFRSLYLQFECGVWMYKSEAVTELRDDFLKTLESCHEIKEEECRGNVVTRFLQDFLRLFAPLM
jgi:cardiolipin synthetase